MDVVVGGGPARHARGVQSTRSARAGLRPVGIDLSAFGMIRALAPEVPAETAEAARSADEERMPPPARTLRSRAPGEALLQPRRRHQPRRGARRDLPVHPCLAVRGRGDRPEARRAPRADPRARPPVARPRRPRRSRRRRSRATRETVDGGSRVAGRGRRQAGRRAAPLAGLSTPPRRPLSRSRASSPAARGPAIPGSSSASSASSALPSRSPARAALRTSTTTAAARLTVSYGLALEE